MKGVLSVVTGVAALLIALLIAYVWGKEDKEAEAPPAPPPPPDVRIVYDSDGCEPLAEIVEDQELLRVSLYRARVSADSVGADAIVIRSIVRDTKGINAYKVTATAVLCGEEEQGP